MPKFLPAALLSSACLLCGCAGQTPIAVPQPVSQAPVAHPPVNDLTVTHRPVALLPRPEHKNSTNPRVQNPPAKAEKENLAADKVSRVAQPTSIRPGDRLNISVWREDDLSHIYQLDEKGEIAFPLIGAVKASGRDISVIRADIADRLRGGYLLNPQVSVELLPPENCGCRESHLR